MVKTLSGAIRFSVNHVAGMHCVVDYQKHCQVLEFLKYGNNVFVSCLSAILYGRVSLLNHAIPDLNDLFCTVLKIKLLSLNVHMLLFCLP